MDIRRFNMVEIDQIFVVQAHAEKVRYRKLDDVTVLNLETDERESVAPNVVCVIEEK